MSYIEKAKQNQANAASAQKWNEMQEGMRIREEAERLLADVEKARINKLVSEFAPTQREYEIQLQADEMAKDLGRPISESDYATAARNWTPSNNAPSLVDQIGNALNNAAEGVSDWWSNTKNRMNNFDYLTNQSKDELNRYESMGQEMKKQMEDDAFQTAIDRAGSMGNRSEENINKLIEEELKKRGL